MFKSATALRHFGPRIVRNQKVFMRLTPFSLPPAQQADPASLAAVPSRSRVLWLSCVAHALHDGYTDMIYVMLPVWQTDFGLGYSALAMLRGIYAGTMATLQLPAGRLANRVWH